MAWKNTARSSASPWSRCASKPEERWQRARLEAFVSDENGIIILSSDPARRLKSVRPLSDETKERLARSLQYYWCPLNELQPWPASPGRWRGKTDLPGQQRSGERRARSQLPGPDPPLNDTPWNFTLLTPLQDLRREAINQGILVAVAFGLVAILLIAWNERRKVIATRLPPAKPCRKPTASWSGGLPNAPPTCAPATNASRARSANAARPKKTLRRAQDELVQAGKLAAIGQMSTSIAHELNQPLAALRTLSGNTVRFLERGALETASANLKTINDLIDRMGRITASLRSFARRGDDQGQASLGKAVDAALQVLGAGQPAADLHRDFAPATADRPDPPGTDPGQPDRQRPRRHAGNRPRAVAGRRAPTANTACVRDNGHGIDAEARKHLFEPFFTTKPGEQGLGLGLTLSASLAAATGGNLAVEHPAGGGTAFVLCLPLAGAPAEST
jgi:two-component system sensor histidine kinase AauS